MIIPNWHNFRAKFNDNPQKYFEWFCYLLFCQEFNKAVGIFRYKNQSGIETNPITRDGEVIGWQAKFYETTLSNHKKELIETVTKSKRDYQDLSKIIIYTNQEWGQGKEDSDPVAKKEVEQIAVGTRGDVVAPVAGRTLGTLCLKWTYAPDVNERTSILVPQSSRLFNVAALLIRRRGSAIMTEKQLDYKRFVVEIIVAILLLCTLGASIYSNHISSQALKQSEIDSKYRYLTGVWNDIMRESINYPEFNDKANTLNYATGFKGKKKIQYESYVRWIGGLIEDLYYKEYERENWSFFDPWIDSMLDIHRVWFIEHRDYYAHTTSFYKRLDEIKKRESNR